MNGLDLIDYLYICQELIIAARFLQQQAGTARAYHASQPHYCLMK